LKSILAPILVILTVGAFLPAGSSGHYIPSAGLYFNYEEITNLNDGKGIYSGYTQQCYINGTERVIGVSSGIASMNYSYVCTFENNTGVYEPVSAAGNYTFSTQTFQYVNGTDNLPCYVDRPVWFYMNNSLSTGNSFDMLNNTMQVVSTNYSYKLQSTGNYVETIYAEGNGSFQSGNYTATYNCKAYYDPSTGFIVGYLYTGHYTSNSGNGYVFTESLFVTGTSYSLTPAVAPPSSSSGSSLFLYLFLFIIILIAVIVLIVALSRRNKGEKLPKHPSGGNVNFNQPASYQNPPEGGQAPPPLNFNPQQPAVQQIVVQEVVKVKCKYCGSLMDSTAERCPVCGAPQR
jgi:hypothetical protein